MGIFEIEMIKCSIGHPKIVSLIAMPVLDPRATGTGLTYPLVCPSSSGVCSRPERPVGEGSIN